MRLLLALPLAATLLASACDTCVPERCYSPRLLLTVRDATSRAPLPDAYISQGGVAVAPFPSSYCASGGCTHAISPPAGGLLTVSHPDYRQASVNYVPGVDACGNTKRQAVDVDLVEAAAPGPSEVSATRDLGASCNIN